MIKQELSTSEIATITFYIKTKVTKKVEFRKKNVKDIVYNAMMIIMKISTKLKVKKCFIIIILLSNYIMHFKLLQWKFFM